MSVNLYSTNYSNSKAYDGNLRFHHLGYEECMPSQSWGPSVKNSYFLFIVFRGKGTFKDVQRTFDLSSGHIFLITPDTITNFTADLQYPWTYGWLAFNGTDAQSYMARAGLSADTPVLSLNPSTLNRLESILKKMFLINKEKKSKDILFLSHFYSILALLVEENPSKAASREIPCNLAYVNAAVDYIKANYSNKITCEGLASFVGIHRKYLNQLFKEALGISPQEYLISCRIEKAKTLLLQSDLSISEIAFAVGYEDSLVFSKAFKKRTGVSPSLFLKSVLSLAE